MSKAVQTKHYQGFRGIDLASDPTLCSYMRSPYIINMYKDYQASFGKAVETVAGFRKSINLPINDSDSNIVHNIFFFKKFIDGKLVLKPLIHVGKRLYLWECFPKPMNIQEIELSIIHNCKCVLSINAEKVVKVLSGDVEIPFTVSSDGITLNFNVEDEGKKIAVYYYENQLLEMDFITNQLCDNKSSWFVKNNQVYIMDGAKIYSYDGLVFQSITPFVPSTYIGISATDIGTQKEFRNMLSPQFYNTIVADGTAKKYYFSEKNVDEVISVELYGTIVPTSNYTINLLEGWVEFSVPPERPIDKGYDEGFAGITILLSRLIAGHENMVVKMTKGGAFDSRLFLANNQENKNLLVYSALDDYTYFPEINYINIGLDDSKIQDILVSGNDLIVLKNDSEAGSVFTLTPFDTGITINPKAYAVGGTNGSLGAVGDAFNFIDEPIFLSRLGLKSIVSPDLKSMRALEGRSSLIDSELLRSNPSGSILFEWSGYLCVYLSGVLYLGDPRMRYSNELGEREYEWFKIEGVGSFDNQYQRYDFAKTLPTYLLGVEKLAPSELLGEFANLPNELGISQREVVEKSITVLGKTYNYQVVTVKGELAVGLVDGGIEYENVQEDYLVEMCDDFIGGVFNPATDIISYGDNIYFGNTGGVYSFNFDKKINGELDENYYSFDNRVIKNGVATCLDNLGCPNLRKSTVKKSLVIKCKTKRGSHAKVKVRTDKKSFEIVGNINNSYFSFDTFNFINLSFNTSDQQIFMCNEGEKNWVEKQIFVYQDEYKKPFSIYYITYQYMVRGKIKNK